MSILTALGAAAWPFLRVLVPLAGPKTVLVLIAALGLLASHGGVAGYVWMNGYRARVDAVAENDRQWIEKLQKAKAEHENRIADALEAAEAEPPVSADRATRLRECQQSPSCRDRRRQ